MRYPLTPGSYNLIFGPNKGVYFAIECFHWSVDWAQFLTLRESARPENSFIKGGGKRLNFHQSLELKY